MGPEYNILEPGPEQCRRLWLEQPILSRQDMSTLKTTTYRGWKVVVLLAHSLPTFIRVATEGCVCVHACVRACVHLCVC